MRPAATATPSIARLAATTPLLIAGCAAALALGGCGSGSDGSSPAAEEPPGPALHPCDLDAGPNWRCGHISVPAVRGDESLGEQRIGFAVLSRGDQDRPPLAPMVAVEGGPGYASTNSDSAKAFKDAFGPLLRRRDLVLIDQRGTGSSEVVDCPGLQRERIDEDIATAECANQLGPRYQGFTSAESADDIEAVRQALRLGKVTLYGDSYGTFLSQAYSVRYPDSLESMVLSSPYPADDPFWRTLYPAGVHALRLACERSAPCRQTAAARCGESFPCSWGAAARFREVMRRLRQKGRGDDDLLLILLEGGTWSPGSYLGIDRGVTEYLSGEPQRLRRLIDPGRPGGGDPGYYSYGMAQAVECNDYPMPWDRSADFDERVAQLDQAIKDFPKPKLFAPLSVRQWMMMPASGLVDCLAWPAPTDLMEPPIPEGDEQPADLPVLVIAGEFDDITSVVEAHQVARLFGDSEYYETPSRGHASDLYYPYRSPAVGAIRRFVASN